jgi:hypothetical protein
MLSGPTAGGGTEVMIYVISQKAPVERDAGVRAAGLADS